MYKRIFCFLLALSILVSNAACSRKKENIDTSIALPVFKEVDLGSIADMKFPLNLRSDKQNNLVVYDEDGDVKKYIFVDAEGKKVKEIKCDFKGGGSIFTLDQEDNLYAMVQENLTDHGNPEKKEVAFTLYKYTPEGIKEKEIDLGKQDITDNLNYVIDLAVDEKGYAYIARQNENIEVIDNDGKKIARIGKNGFNSLVFINKGVIVGVHSGGKSMEAFKADTGESIWTIASGENELFRKIICIDKKIYMVSDKSIGKYSKDGKLEEVMFDIMNSSIAFMSGHITGFWVDAGENIYINTLETGKDGKDIAIFHKFIPDPTQKAQKAKIKKTLTIAETNTSRKVELAKFIYEQQHPDTLINIKNYDLNSGDLKMYRTREEDFLRVMSTELMAGNGPDIIVFNSSQLPYKKYAGKGVITDLSKIISNDKSFNIQDYCTNIIDGCKYKGNLYAMPLGFSFRMMMTNSPVLDKKSIVIDDDNWSWMDIEKIAKEIYEDANGDGIPENYMMDSHTYNEMVFQWFESFIDYDNKTSLFESALGLEFLKFYERMDSEKYVNWELNYENLKKKIKTGETVFSRAVIQGYSGFWYNRKQFGNDLRFYKIPSFPNMKDKRAFETESLCLINNNSSYKDDAWEFLKVILSEEVQSVFNSNPMFPLNKRALEQQAEICKEYTNFQPQDIDTINQLISELNYLMYSDRNIDEIFYEGIRGIHSGQYSAEEVADIMKNKIETYMME